MAGVGSKTELLNVLGEVKARVQDKLGIVDFPMPQFILIGKQSVGKSRLIEALAGETFNFISGTLGSRRPTVLEFRNVASDASSRWFVRDRETGQWGEHPVAQVMQIVGSAHEELRESVSPDPIYVRIESPACVDMQIVDLPGFRDFAVDPSKQELSNKIEDLVKNFMEDPRNVMLCVEQAGDAATMSTLARCRQIDPDFRRTILIRNKLDKYYKDLTPETVTQWVEGFGDLPKTLTSFAVTLPFWQDGTTPTKNFVQLREDMNDKDLQVMQELGLQASHFKRIGFKHFADYMEVKIEQMFAAAIDPVLEELKSLKQANEQKESGLKIEQNETDGTRILQTTRECGISFAEGLNYVMEGFPSKVGRVTLEQELRDFHAYHQSLNTDNFTMLPSEDFCGLDDYIEYLTTEAPIGAWDVEVNGGAQFRRVMAEVEIFLRFSEIAVEIKKRDVVQARGVSMTSLTWRDVVVKLLSNEAHLALQRRVRYVAERIKWFFMKQKEIVLEFMVGLESSASSKMFSAMLPKNGKLIKANEIIRNLIFEHFDRACETQLKAFIELFENMLTSTFSNPWVFLKGATASKAMEAEVDASEEGHQHRIPEEIKSRSSIETTLNRWLMDIPTEAHEIDDAVDKVQMLVLKTYSFIRSQVCDQVEIFAESFFKLPMLRRLMECMQSIELSQTDQNNYQIRRERLDKDMSEVSSNLVEVNECIKRLQDFKLTTQAKSGI